MRQAEFNDPRLVPVYDAAYGWGGDDDFFVAVIAEEAAVRVLDLGCGTGRLTLGLADAGYEMTGVDPATASLAAARAKPGADRVTWIAGTSADLPDPKFQAALMTSHVAQFLVEDAEWHRTLADLHRALVPGGRLVFDTRNPADRGWKRWNRHQSVRLVELPDGHRVETWVEVTDERDGVVDFAMHFVFPDGEELVSDATMRFRTEDEVRQSLQDNGFRVDRIYGGWRREPVGEGDGELLVIARSST